MKAQVFLWLALQGSAAADSPTELARVVASMKPGTWAELKTEGYGTDLLKVQNHHILEYTDTAVWDPKSQQVLFVGQGHYSAVKFIAYSAVSNSWKLMPTPTWWKGDPQTGKGPIGHAYQNNAIDPAKGLLYHHQSATRLVHRYDIAKSEWTTLPELTGAAVGHGTALAYFPERKGLVRVLAGVVHFYDEEKNAWSILKEKAPMGPYHNIARYNPVDKSVIFGAGNGSKTLHRLDASGSITPLKDAPFVIRISSTVTAVDPVSGDLLVLSMDDKKKFYALNLKQNDWRQLPDAPISEGVATSIDMYGVTMYFANQPAKVYLYKHAAVPSEKSAPRAQEIAPDTDDADVRFAQEWGKRGSKPGEFNFPIGISVGPNNEVFVTDFYNDRVQRFTDRGRLLTCFAVKPHPAGIAVGRGGEVFVSHFNLNRSKPGDKQDRVTVYDSEGKFLREWGKTGKGDGEFEAPGGIAIAKDGEVYVTDQINHRVQVFTPEGKLVRKWGEHGSKPGQFGGKVPASSRWGGPHFLAFDSAGNVYTTEGADYRAQKFTAKGDHVLTWGDDQDRPGSFGRKLAPLQAGINGPIGICVDQQDRVWVAAVGGLVQQFSSAGKLLRAVGQVQGTGPGQFQAPHGLAVDSRNNLYVVDTYNHRIQKFATSMGR